MFEIPEETSQIDSRAMDEILSAAALEMCTAPTTVPIWDHGPQFEIFSLCRSQFCIK